MEELIGLFDPNLGDSDSEFEFEDFENFEDFDQFDNNNEKSDSLPTELPPEEFYGAVEYKRQLIKPTSQRITHLVTQMQFRLTEGGGECRYMLGVDDDGSLHGLLQTELDETLKTLNIMAGQLNAETKILRRRQCGADRDKWAVELLVRQIPPEPLSIQHRVAVLGNVDAGKSTLVGVLTNGELDNGKGKSRLQMFRHPHEITTGRTSSISVDALRFGSDGPIYGNQALNQESETMKIVEFWDLAGDIKYMKTTVYGLTSSAPDVVMVVISGNKGVGGTTLEQLQIAKALKLPIFVVLTKTDLCSPSQIQKQIQSIEKFLSDLPFNFLPIVINSESKVANVSRTFSKTGNLAPIFTTSSVTGQGLKLVTSFLNLLPVRAVDANAKLGPVEFKIDQFWCPEMTGPGDGTIIHGRLEQGIIKRGEKLKIGPNDEGSFVECKVISIKRNDVVTRSIEAGQVSTLKIVFDPKNLGMRKGLVLISESDQETSSMQFRAECEILDSEISTLSPKRKSVRVGQLVTAHLDNVRQTVRIDEVLVDSKRVRLLNFGEKGTVLFTFIRHPEFIHPKSSMVFRDNQTKGCGKVSEVFSKKKLKSVEELRKTHRLTLNSI